MSMIDPKGSGPSDHANFLELLKKGKLCAVSREATEKRECLTKELFAPDIDAA